jgi:16S rRNA (uracil1498-N3)-methyltransferase
VPVEAGRSEKGLREAAEKRLDRWKRVVLESARQCRRDSAPEIRRPVGFAACLAEAAPYRYWLEEEPGALPLARSLPPLCRPSDRAALLAGPEGGWTDRERERAAAAGWTPVSLGPLILRAETAVLAAVSVLVCTWQAREPR